MSANRETPHSPKAEETAAGRQTLIACVRAISLRERLAVEAARPLAPRAPQKRCDHGLFDLEARRQTDLIDELRRLNRQSKPEGE